MVDITLNTLPWHKHPRYTLGHWPTPLEPLRNLSAELGGPTIWVKRDDCSGLAVGGNKTRKLEYLVGDALQQGADSVITFGAVQSNHARQTAAACAKAGLACYQVLSQSVADRPPAYETNGNVLLGNLLGAQQYILAPQDVRSFTQALLTQLRDSGHRPYVIPAGGSNALGALGYATCVEELMTQSVAQEVDLSCVIHASSSAGTQAGLLYGLAQYGHHCKVLGINVYHDNPATLKANVTTLVNDLQQSFGTPEAPIGPVEVNHAYLGDGYGHATADCQSAIRSAASVEGLIFDPVYSGKALSATMDQIAIGNLNEHRDIVLIHTGGSPALYVYDQELLAKAQ